LRCYVFHTIEVILSLATGLITAHFWKYDISGTSVKPL
jgi:hypothetical protein